MRLKLFGLNFFLFLIALAVFLFPANSVLANSSDAIAVRIIPNPDHYSVSRWFASQNFIGSPQSVNIDGYDIIRDGRTAYVDIANIQGRNLYTNILIISYNQDFEVSTVDIFGQLIKNLKFNTNISELGKCSVTTNAACLYNKDCPAGEYCNSQKAKIIRDVKRLEDLSMIKSSLGDYKKSNDSYVQLKSGTYIPGISLSTWPSWQQTLGAELGAGLPVDPLNKLGDCPGYNSITCWDEKNLKFASNLSNFELPADSHVYLYYSSNNGQTVRYCAQMESGYANIAGSNCFEDRKINNHPNIDSVSLSGTPGEEFVGYATLSDPDNDELSLSVDLDTPDRNTWTSKNWKWEAGKNNFVVLPTANPNQKKIYALKTGDYSSVPGYYKVKLSVNDGKGEANSIFSQVYPITLNQAQISISNITETAVIGSGISASMSGRDANGEDIRQVFFQSANLDGTSLSEAELKDMGFSLSGVSLSEIFKNKQKTGVYTVNVSSSNTGRGGSTAAFVYKITNTPPVLNKLVANFSNNTSQTCNNSENCTIAIDNGEAATITLTASDTPNHIVSYSLKDNFSNSIKIDASSGKITGLEKLNYKSSSDKIFNISVKMSDQYCSNSKEEECSSVYSFNVLVKGYCSVSDPRTLTQKVFPGPVTVNKSGDTANFGSLDDCSAIGSSSVNIKLLGVETTLDRNQAIVVVSDISESMKTNVTIGSTSLPAVTRLEDALARQGDGFIDKVYKIAKERLARNLFIDISMVAYNNSVQTFYEIEDFSTPIDILKSGVVNTLKRTAGVYRYFVDGETNTLAALNEAETRLDKIQDASTTDKIVILFSDGKPTLSYRKKNYYCWERANDCLCTEYGYPNEFPPNCQNHINHTRDLSSCPYEFRSDGAGGYIYNDWLDLCGYCRKSQCSSVCQFSESIYKRGFSNFCNCPSGQDPFNTTYNNLQRLKNFFISLFKPKVAQAVTTQSQCVDIYSNKYEDVAAECIDPDLTDHTIYSVEVNLGEVTNNCDTSDDVLKQAEAMKKKGILIYTVYYNTTNNNSAMANMCKWSSNNGQNCNNDTYAYSGKDIDDMVQKIINNLILNKPKNIAVNGQPVTDSDPTRNENIQNIEVKGLTCGNINPVATYENSGSLEFSNLTVNYCPAKLH